MGTETVELWDIYDEERRKTGRVHRRGEKMKEGEYHLVVHVCVFNHKNELLIQQRQPFKEGWPNMWDLTVGGSAVMGDSSRTAAERELLEEIGLQVDLSDQSPHFTIHFPTGFDDYYLIWQDVDLSTLTLQQEEVQKVKWADKEEVLKMEREGTFIPYWFLSQLFELRDWYQIHRKENGKVKIKYAEEEQISSWMSLVEILRDNFPGLETKQKIEAYKETLLKNIERKTAICALFGNMVVGVLLFSKKHNKICCMGVHPEFRRKKIASLMVKEMFLHMDKKRPIVVETFREEDEKGEAPRAFYKTLGFQEGELCLFENQYLEQKFYLRNWEQEEE